MRHLVIHNEQDIMRKDAMIKMSQRYSLTINPILITQCYSPNVIYPIFSPTLAPESWSSSGGSLWENNTCGAEMQEEIIIITAASIQTHYQFNSHLITNYLLLVKSNTDSFKNIHHPDVTWLSVTCNIIYTSVAHSDTQHQVSNFKYTWSNFWHLIYLMSDLSINM